MERLDMERTRRRVIDTRQSNDEAGPLGSAFVVRPGLARPSPDTSAR